MLTIFTEKYVLALKCLKAATAIDAECPRVHEQSIALAHALKSASDLPPKALEAIKAEFTAFDANADLHKINDSFRAKHAGSPLHILASLKAARILGQDKASNDKELLSLLNLKETNADDALEIVKQMASIRSSEVENFRKAATAKWPEVTRLTI